jgi:signal transduction histidine kinase
MAAVLAHEIRNPLSSIRGTAEILKDDYQPGDPKYEFIEIQIRETDRLNRVVEEFLLMARPQPLEMLPCPLLNELETIVTLVSNDARERQINLLLQWQDIPIVIVGNGEKLRQAFLNIVINALQATPPGGEVTISTKVSASGFCEINFRDNGMGIAVETMTKIFEPFFTTKSEGCGLGLAITRKIIESHNGTVHIESQPGIGTMVTVTLPMQKTTH